MPSRWAAVLAPGSTSRQEFDKLLVQRVEQEFEPEEDIISCVLTSLLEAADVKALTAELDEVFEDQAGVISEWCWETLTQLAARQSQTSESGTVAESDSPPNAAAQQQERAEQQQQQQQTSKRAPIRFSLQEAAPETAPKKASDDKAQRLGANSKPAAPQPQEKKPQQQQAPAPAVLQPSSTRTEQQQPQHQQQQQQRQPTRPAPNGSSASTRGQRGAPAASARLLSMTGLIRPAEGPAGSSGGRDSRVQRRQQDHREQQQQQPLRLEQQQQSPQQRKRSLEEPAEPSRPAPGASSSARRGPASAVAGGAGSMFRSAVGSLMSGSRQPEAAAAAPQQQQQQAGATGVFARINREDLARLGVPQPQQQAAGSKQAPAGNRRPDTQQQQQHHHHQPQGFIDGLPKSLQGRLGGLPGRPPAAAQGAASAAQHSKPSAAAAGAAASVVGAKRKAEVAPSAAAAPKASAPGKAAPPAQAQEATKQQQQQGMPTAKKTRTAAAAAPTTAAAAGSKEAELAALRAQLQAREAEVLRLKQAAESDAVSVAVFGVSPRVPDTVLMAHFRPAAQGCGANIRRCTLLAGRFPPHVAAPGAYVEFEGLGGDAAGRARAAAQATANALQLSGSMLLDQKITVVRKADWQANQSKGQRVYAQPTAGGNRSWRLEPGVGPGSVPAGNAAAGVAGS